MGIENTFGRLRVENASGDVFIADINKLIVPDTWLVITGPDEATLIVGDVDALTSLTNITIDADTDANGSGTIALRTRNLVRLTVNNDGTLTATSTLKIAQATPYAFLLLDRTDQPAFPRVQIDVDSGAFVLSPQTGLGLLNKRIAIEGAQLDGTGVQIFDWALGYDAFLTTSSSFRIMNDSGTTYRDLAVQHITLDGAGSESTLYMGKANFLVRDLSSNPRLQASSDGVTVFNHLLFNTDNAADLGQVSFVNFRPRDIFAGRDIYAGGVLKTGTGPTTLTDAAGKILSAALNTVAVAQGGTGAVDAANARTNLGAGIVNAASQSVLGAAFSITGTSGTYQDTGLSVALPAAGTYLISANMRMALTSNAGTFWFITAKLFNSTDTADVANSETMGAVANAAGTIKYTMPLNAIVTVAAAKTIKLYAARHTDGSFTVSDIPSDASGRTRLSYVQIA